MGIMGLISSGISCVARTGGILDKDESDTKGMERLVDLIREEKITLNGSLQFVDSNGKIVARTRQVAANLGTYSYKHLVYNTKGQYLGYISKYMGINYYNILGEKIAWDRPEGMFQDEYPDAAPPIIRTSDIHSALGEMALVLLIPQNMTMLRSDNGMSMRLIRPNTKDEFRKGFGLNLAYGRQVAGLPNEFILYSKDKKIIGKLIIKSGKSGTEAHFFALSGVDMSFNRSMSILPIEVADERDIKHQHFWWL